MAPQVPFLLKTSVLVFVLWRLVRRIRCRSTIAHLRGPHKEHWLKGVFGAALFAFTNESPGNYHRIFQDGLKYNLHLADTYGGAVKIHAVLGVIFFSLIQ